MPFGNATRLSREGIGEVLGDQGNLPAALDAFKAAVAIKERLATADPGNAFWQRRLALGLGRVAIGLARSSGGADNAL